MDAALSRRGSLLLVLPLIMVACSQAQETHPTDIQVKAAYLYNFGKFVKVSPDRRVDSFEICVIGKDPFGTVLDSTVAGESIDGRQIAVRRLANIQAAEGCSVLFISSSEEARLATILPSAQRWSLLTVSDLPRFAERGGNIGLITHNDRVRFEVNRASAEKSHLELSSELLKLATRVIATSNSGN